MNYATKEDVAVWLGHETPEGEPDVTKLPEDIVKLIRNASMLMDDAAMHRVNIYNVEQMDELKNAVSAQVEYWIDGVGESSDINPDVSGYSVNGSSFTFAGGRAPKLAPRARRALRNTGLLSRAVVRR